MHITFIRSNPVPCKMRWQYYHVRIGCATGLLQHRWSVDRLSVSVSGGLRPLIPWLGVLPWAPLGAPSPNPRYRLALRARHGQGPSTFYRSLRLCWWGVFALCGLLLWLLLTRRWYLQARTIYYSSTLPARTPGIRCISATFLYL